MFFLSFYLIFHIFSSFLHFLHIFSKKKAINQAFATYSKPDFEEFFTILIKELNIYSIKLLNSDKEPLCYEILVKCDHWTQPGIFGSYPDLRVFIYNHFGCYHRRSQNLELALSFLMKALKLLNVSQNEHYLGLTHMNIAAVLSHLGEFSFDFYCFIRVFFNF